MSGSFPESDFTPSHISGRGFQVSADTWHHAVNVTMASSTSFPTGAQGLQPLHVAVIANDLASVKELLRHGANIDMRTRAGATPLMLACLFARRRMMLLLLTKKASHKVKDSRDNTIRDYLRPHPRILARFQHPAFRNLLARSKKRRSRIKRDFCSREAFRSRTKSRDHPLRDCVFHPQKGRIELLNVISVVKPGPGAHDDKTRGCIAGEGHEKPTVFAISGWADDSRAGILGNSEYTDKVSSSNPMSVGFPNRANRFELCARS